MHYFVNIFIIDFPMLICYFLLSEFCGTNIINSFVNRNRYNFIGKVAHNAKCTIYPSMFGIICNHHNKYAFFQIKVCQDWKNILNIMILIRIFI